MYKVRMNPVERLIEKFGTQERLAKAAERKQSQVPLWKDKGHFPPIPQKNILKNARKFGVAVTPDDFFDLPAPEKKQTRAS